MYLVTSRHLLVINCGAFTVLSVAMVNGSFNHRVVVEKVHHLVSALETMVGDYALSDTSVLLRLFLVEHNEQQVETREQRVREADILADRLVAGIVAVDRVGSCDNRAAGVEAGVDAGLGNGNSLLLHHFVDSYSVVVVHLVELIDTDDTAIGKDHSASFQVTFSCVLVDTHCSSETDSGRAAACGVDREGRNVNNVSEQLRLGRRRVTDHHQVDITSEMGAIGQRFLSATEKLQ